MIKKIVMFVGLASLLVLAGCSGSPPEINTGTGSTTPTSSNKSSQPTSSGVRTVRLKIVMTQQACRNECGFLFDTAKLNNSRVIKAGLVKKQPKSDINLSFKVRSSSRYVLRMKLNRGEGIANEDNSSVAIIYSYRNGRWVGVFRLTAGYIKRFGDKSSRPTISINLRGA